MSLRGIDPLAPILRAWAAKSGTGSAIPSVDAKRERPTGGPVTPCLDKVEKLLAELVSATTPKNLRPLQKKFDELEPTDLIDEDAERWQELLERLTSCRNNFAFGTKEHEIVQSIYDAMSST